TDHLIKAQNIYMRLSDYEKAKRILRRLIREYPEEDQYKIELATIYSETGRADSAMTLLQPIAAENPHSDAAALLGELYFQTGRMDSAYSTLLPLDEGDSTDVRVLYYLGGAALNQDSLNAAEGYYRQLMDRHTDILGGYFGLGVVLRRQERYQDAIEVLSQGVRNFPDEPELYEHLGINYYFTGQQDSAWNQLDRAYAIDSTLAGYYNLAITLRNEERSEEAIAVLSRAKQMYPPEAELYEQLGIAYYAGQQYQEAKQQLLEALSLKPDQLRPKHFLAFVYDQLGQQDSAEVIYKELLEAVPDEPLYLNNLAYLYAVQGKNLETALEFVKKALERAPNNASYLDTMGWVYYKMGQYEEAREYISEALHRDSTNVEVLDHMGDVYSKLGNREMAQEFYKKALEKNPENALIRKKLQ
ncbi:MAG TPA: tetratricopeptide repeat protein, partial [bacterium]|nr:tetratricopeptide repeat protein [bacterium]